MHNITFTGLGLLDKVGADENAKILTVATNNNTEDSQMSEKEKTTPDMDKNPDLEVKLKELQTSADEKDDRIKELENQIEKLTKDLDKSQKLVESLEKEKKASLQKAKAESLLKKWESMGREFASDEDREKELSRLAGLSEDALFAIEETVTSFESMNQVEDKVEEKNIQANRKTQGNVKPKPIDDGDVSLTDQLTNGFLQAYKSRIGE